MALSSPSPHQLTVESWTMYSVGIFLIACRLYSRRLVLGSIRGLQIEDWLMLFNACLYTTLMVGINISGRTATNLLQAGELETLTAEDIQLRIYGSKIVILLEQSMLIVTWGIKGCMILMYHRLTCRLYHQYIIRLIAVYIVCGFFACELTWFLSCTPFSGYWALPVPDEQCATYQHYSIVQAIFNISSDMMMLAVGIPLFVKAKVPMKKKIILVSIFGCGVFVILAAILNKVYNFSNPYTTIYMLWYIRESSTAMYVSNLPMLWPLFRHAFNFGSFADGSSNKYQQHSDSLPLSKISKKKVTTTSFTGSEEGINKLEIEQRISFTVEESSIPGGIRGKSDYDVEALDGSATKGGSTVASS